MIVSVCVCIVFLGLASEEVERKNQSLISIGIFLYNIEQKHLSPGRAPLRQYLSIISYS